MHDARVLRKSDLGTRISENAENIFYRNYHLVADSAYPLNEYILTPFRDNGYLNAQQKNFNRKLSSIRISIEHVFGILKSRFRILRYVNKYNTLYIPQLVLACCILHNICAKQKDNIELEELVMEEQQVDANAIGDQENSGIMKRNYITSIL